MTDRIHGRPSSMLAYQPEGPKQVRAAGPVRGMMAQQANFTTKDQDAEQNLVRYMGDADQGVQRYRVSVNSMGGEYAESADFHAGQFTRISTGREA
jgi:hypothetical protein